MKSKRVWLTGASGQLGQTLLQHFSAPEGIEWISTTRNTVDLLKPQQLKDFFEAHKPDAIVNAAAYTQVDAAENNPINAALVNSNAPKELAHLCKQNNTCLIHISTDYVFGSSSPLPINPYTETDLPHPVNVYGRTKREGEHHIQTILPNHYILRTSWLYSPYGRNFYLAIREKLTKGETLKVVSNEVGSPTSAFTLSQIIVECLQRLYTPQAIPYGIYHCSNSGNTSRYQWAKAIAQLHPKTKDATIIPCQQADYPTLAPRPTYSVLSNNKISSALNSLQIPNWLSALHEVFLIEQSNIQ